MHNQQLAAKKTELNKLNFNHWLSKKKDLLFTRYILFVVFIFVEHQQQF